MQWELGGGHDAETFGQVEVIWKRHKLSALGDNALQLPTIKQIKWLFLQTFGVGASSGTYTRLGGS